MKTEGLNSNANYILLLYIVISYTLIIRIQLHVIKK